MVVTKPQKFARSVAENSKFKNGYRKSGSKKIFLKSAARNMIVMPNTQSNGSKKKVVCVKKRCLIQMKRKQRLPSHTAQDSKDRVSSWLKNQVAENLQDQSSEPVSTADSDIQGSNFKTKTPSKEETEINTIFQSLVPSKVTLQNSMENILKHNTVHNDDVMSHAEESALKSSAENIALQSENIGNGTMSSISFKNSAPTTLECGISNLVTGNPSTENQKKNKVRRISGRPLCAAKSLKARVKSGRQAFQRYYLKNSQGGFRLALKNFKRSKQCKAVNELPITKSVSDNSSKAPMKISLKKRRDPPPSCITPALTPDHDRSVSQFLVSPIGLPAKSVVSCKLPFDSSVDSGLSEDDRSSPEVLTKNQEQNQVREKRDVCYVFALLDREKSETVFKCSPHLKSSEILHQLASVIQTISMDDDVMISRNTCHKSSTNLDSPTTVKKYVERSTSPILCSDDCAQKTPTTDEADGAESSNDSEVPPSIAEFSPEDHLGSAKLCAEECEKTTVTPAIKVMIVKSLMTLTSELKNPTDLSVRLLKWTSTALKGDIDNNMCKDSFEGFLCHCHDKISILLELCHMLDSKFIINLDEAELKNMWLLHDALCCMLQAYRYIQDLSSSPSSTLRQHLLSLMTTCAKTILPTEKVSVPVWISLMTMIQGINEKLCHKDVLSKACQCRHHFISLSINRFCRVCDLNCLYEDLCTGTEKGVQSATQKEKFDLMASPTTVVQQLFPRFSWFLCRIENISEEEFMTAYSKHLVMKFACNSQSGLLPCNEHLSEITCNCLSSLGSGSEAEVDEAALTVTESSNQEKSGVSLSHDSGFDNQRQSIFDVGTCITSESHDNNEVQSSDSSTGSIIPTFAGSPTEVEKCESVPESQADSTSFVETLSLSGQSSDDYTLQLETSPADTTVDSINAKKSNNANPKKPEFSEVHSSGNECSESDKVIEHESDDQHSKSPDIDYSPLNFQLAQSSLENAYSSFDSQTATCSRIPKCSISSHALADKCNQYFRSKSKMPIEEITLDSENSSDISGCMIDNSIAENAVFTHQDRGSETLRLCNKGPLSDSSSVEIEKKYQSKSSHDWNVSEGAHEGSSISLQSSASSDSLEVLSQNKALGSQPSSSMDRTMPLKRKYEDAAFNTKGKQKKLVSPPLCCSAEFIEEIKSLNNCAVEVQPLMENKVHRTRSGRGFRAKQEMLPHNGISIGQSPGNYSSNQNNSSKAAPNVEVKNSKRHPSTRKKGVSQAKEEAEMEQKVENKVNHCGQTQKPAVKCSTHHQLYPSSSRNQSETSFDRKQKISSKEIEQTGVNEDQSHPSPITNGVIEHQNLNCQDDLVKEVDLLEQVGSSNRNRRVGKKLLSLSARMSKMEDVGPAQSRHNIQSRRSAKITTNPVQSQDAGNQVSTSAKSNQESLKICATEDSVLSRCSADETNGSYTSNTEDNSKINEERVSQSSFKVNVKDAKSSKFNDVKNDSAHSLISILKVGCATKNEQDFLQKREETQPDFSAKDNKKVRFSSPDNRYHLIEARGELKRSGRHCRQEKVTINEADAETSSAPEHSNPKGVTVKTLAEPNYLVSSETKPVRKRQSQRIIKSNTQLVATEKDVALKERSRNEEALPKSREAANSETNNFTASEMISKNKLVSVSCSEIPIRNHKGKVKTNVSGQIPDSNAFEEHVEKLSKRKRPKNAVEEQFPPKEVIEKAPEVVQRLQKLKKPKKEKNVVSTVTEKCQSNNYDNAWKNYIAGLRERLQ